jgi:hypothetical protein
MLTASTRPIGSGAPVGWFGTGQEITISAAPADYLLEQAAYTLQRRAALQRDPVVGVKKPFGPKAKPGSYRGWPDDGDTWLLRDLMPELARTYGVQFISDAYWDNAAVVEAQALAAQPTPLFAVLDGERTRDTHHWDRKGDLIRLRSRTWFLDRPREVPLPLVHRWQDLIRARGALSLEEYMAMTTALTDDQLYALDDVVYQTDLPDDLREVAGARHALRLYASLSSAQRKALWQGGTMPAQQMTPPQRALFRAALQENLASGSRWEQWPDWTFSLTHERFIRTRSQREGSAKYDDEPETPPQEDPAAGAEAPPDASSVPTAETEAPPGFSSVTTAAPNSTTLHSVTHVEFQFQYGPEKRASFSLTIASPP